MDRSEMMTSNSEQVVNGAVAAEKALDSCRPDSLLHGQRQARLG